MDEIRIYVDDTPSGLQRVALEIPPVLLCHVRSRRKVYRHCDDWKVSRATARRADDFELLPENELA